MQTQFYISDQGTNAAKYVEIEKKTTIFHFIEIITLGMDGTYLVFLLVRTQCYRIGHSHNLWT